MDIWAIIGGVGIIIGIIAGVVQVLDYLQKQREKPHAPSREDLSPTQPPVPQIPHNLPPRSEFIGRETEKALAHEALRSRSCLVSIDGIGGIGKTALALEVAHECLHASQEEDRADDIANFDGFIWVTAKDRELGLDDLLDAVARALDYPGISQKPLDEKKSAIRKLLCARPYLLIVDNLQAITDERVHGFLNRLPEPSKALITTRKRISLEARMFSLEDLKEAEALNLMRSEGKRLGLTAVVQANDQALSLLYQSTGGAPLAIKWAVGQIRQRGQSLGTVLAALHGAKASIFDNIFVHSWKLLSADARQALMVMPLFATSASWEGIEAVSGVHGFDLDEALGQLVEMSLIDVTDELARARQRYSIHPLTRAFVAAKLEEEPKVQQVAQRCRADFFQSFTRDYGGLWNQEGFAQLEPELPNILAVVQWCWEQQKVSLGLEIVYNILHFMFQRGYWSSLMTLGQEAVEQSTKAGDNLSAAQLRVVPIAWVHRHWDNLNLAEKHAASALTVLEQFGQERDIALAKRELGRIARERGDLQRADNALKEALVFFQSSGDKRFIYTVTANLADVALQQADLDTAWSLCSTALPSARQYGDSDCIAQLLSVLGSIATQRGNFQQAKEFWTESLSRMKEINCLDGTAEALLGLAKIGIEIGKQQTARQMLLDALGIYKQLSAKSRIQEIETLLDGLLKSADQEQQQEGYAANKE